ncbi:outer membrane beta-barrel protein [Pedobacter nyackensis]|uniref:Outer membrane protein beta-barrel domain-containing protein n=1 Tax=Pedobacter nyackensis TaxID=475255 RepID=A0A1W2DMQ3_9SPHI|nr:outer membrane beta-barrel protein [Pedobacter nyackensis]SMC98739.1 hypothetical protein SAMN04488101_107217 [Pedobacter nyackensis]
MTELNDNEFDATFRKKVFDADPQFEEAAWDKMEQKLNRRDRVVFFRKAGALCLLLLIGFGGFMLLDKDAVKTQVAIVNKNKSVPVIQVPETSRPVMTRIDTEIVKVDVDRAVVEMKKTNVFVVARYRGGQGVSKQDVLKQDVLRKDGEIQSPQHPSALVTDKNIDSTSDNVLVQSTPQLKADSTVTALSGSDVAATAIASVVKKQKAKRRSPLPISLSLSVGPEFNSTGAMVGGKTGFSGGIGVSIGLFKRISLQTGLKYSVKDYGADSYEYSFRNPKIKAIVSEIDASCAVLEIPLIASYRIMEDHRKSIDINAGMSSYIMLSEDYTFSYTAESGFKDRVQHFSGKNQHYFGVVDLSATYYVKLKKEKFKLGLEPFVKIPLTGVGEGRVNLKSSGVSLKLRYDLGKKFN